VRSASARLSKTDTRHYRGLVDAFFNDRQCSPMASYDELRSYSSCCCYASTMPLYRTGTRPAGAGGYKLEDRAV